MAPLTQKGEENQDLVMDKLDFWARYDALTDTVDGAMLDRLDRNLDVLLIFAGLFSAINTAFIVLTLTNLSPPSSYQTNALLTLIIMQANNNTLTSSDLNPSFAPAGSAIRQNCVFFASLATSILAAAGAMVAKQWLQSYGRTGQTGSHENQALRRTEKWLGSRRWRLRPIVESLPTLLLISLALFFFALGDLLWATSRPVAVVFIVFAAIGVTLYGVTVVAAAVDVDCPFQTTISTLVRGIALAALPILCAIYPHLLVQDVIATRMRQLATTGYEVGARLSSSLQEVTMQAANYLKRWRSSYLNTWNTAWSRLWRSSQSEDNHRIQESRQRHDREARLAAAEMELEWRETNYAQAMIWMLENATEPEDLLLTAENIPFLSRIRTAGLVASSAHLPRLVREFEGAIAAMEYTSWRLAGPPTHAVLAAGEDARMNAEASALVYGHAIAHACLADPGRSWKAVLDTLTWAVGEMLHRHGGDHAQVEAICLALSVCGERFQSQSASAVLNEYWNLRSDQTLMRVQPATSLLVARLFKVSDIGLDVGLLKNEKAHSDAFFSLVCMEIVELAEGTRKPFEERLKDVWDVRHSTRLSRTMQDALRAHDLLITRHHDRRGMLDLHTSLLSAFRAFHSKAYRSPSSSTRDELRLIQECFPMSVVAPHISTSIASLPFTQSMMLTPDHDGSKRSRLESWEQRLSRDSRVNVSALKMDLRPYATELLLCLGHEGLLVRESYQAIPPDMSTPQPIEIARLVIDAVVKLQYTVKAEADVVILLRLLGSSLWTLAKENTASSSDRLGPHGPSVDFSSHIPTVTPFLIHSLEYTSRVVLEEAYLLLDTIGHNASHADHTLRDNATFRLESRLCRALTQSSDESKVLSSVFIDLESERSSAGGFLRWLSASIRGDSSSALVSKRSGVMPWLLCLIAQAGQRIFDKKPYNELVVGDIFFLFFTIWNAIHFEASVGDLESESHRIRNAATTSNAALRAISQYGLKTMPKLLNDATNRKMFQHVFAFVTEAFTYRPGAALRFDLDEVCEGLIRRVTEWEKKDLQDQTLRDLAFWWERARRTYVYARYLRDTVGTGWGQLGGLHKACGVSVPGML
ncbi:hypothetical protein FRB98_004071 [Tulasnella sp. 332]|nr:hypothetical protein FRB98_004071 [Tulasnella sp. 332]